MEFDDTQPVQIPAATATAAGPDLAYQRKLTGWFVAFYFSMIFAFIGLGAGLFFTGSMSLSEIAIDIIGWVQTILGMLIGLLTGALKDQLQFHYGSSVGSKAKDIPPMRA